MSPKACDRARKVAPAAKAARLKRKQEKKEKEKEQEAEKRQREEHRLRVDDGNLLVPDEGASDGMES